MNQSEFLAEFGSRTAAYIDGAQTDTCPVLVSIAPAAHSAAGHLLATALINQLARAHRHLIIVGDLDRPLLCRQPFAFDDLRAATSGLALAINPHIEIETAQRLPGGDHLLHIGIGAGGEEPDLQVGCEGWCARFGSEAEVTDSETSVWGAALASALAAAVAFHLMLGNDFALESSYSLWEGGAVGDLQGPAWASPLDLGRVLQVGAGAVGVALNYWLIAVGNSGEYWQLVDGDLVDATNLNRQLLFLAADAGYPDCEPAKKATRAAGLLGAQSDPQLWGKDDALVERQYDLVLALANEDDVRSALQRRQPPLLLHATTSANWQAQVHRHIRGRDDCIECRLPDAPPQLRCSTGEINKVKRIDAALPFLSALAGLLLATELVRLAEGELGDSDVNFRALDLAGEAPVVQVLRFRCHAGCSTWLPSAIRRSIAADTRFAHLD